MSAANPNPMEKSMVSVLVVANAGEGSPLLCGCCGTDDKKGREARRGETEAGKEGRSRGER
jgi:hypothetical protein